MNNQEREAFEVWMKNQFTQARDIPLATEAMQIMGACSEVYWIGFQAGAAYQREQVKGLVEGYGQLKDENWQLKEEAKWATEVTGELVKERDTLRKQLDEANAALGSKNARIAEFAERHLSDFAELERLGKQLDEARELLEEAHKPYGRWEYLDRVDAWLEACSTQR